MKDAPLFYRFRDAIADEYVEGVMLEDIEQDEHSIVLCKETFRGFRRTRKGWWVKASYFGAKPHFILDMTDEERSRKRYPPRRYAYDTEELALKSYRCRKEMQIWRANLANARAKRGLALANERLRVMETIPVAQVQTMERTKVEAEPCATTSQD